jgi:hypothetical protein
MAEQAQYDHARAAFTVALAGLPVANRHLSGRVVLSPTYADVRSPQHFVNHPAIRDGVDTTSVGIETAASHLPGRQPYTGWDGEAGASSPIAGTF